jgi:ribosomal protein S6--L-glutamate ligase
LATVISFHPRLAGDVNLRLSALLGPGREAVARELAQAQAVLLPQTVSAAQFQAVAALCPNVFPDYRSRFGFEGKCGAAALFERLGVPHPRTLRFGSAAALKAALTAGGVPLGYPFVLKGDRGGGGNWVFLIGGEADLAHPLARLAALGWPVVIQEYIDHGGRDARVVVMGEHLFSYWRRQTGAGEFRNNLCRGAVIDRDGEPELLSAAVNAVRGLSQRTGLNLAAFDLVFGRGPEPLFLEVNYLFGRKGLARGGDYYTLLARAAEGWLAGLGVSCRIRPVIDFKKHMEAA